MLGAAHKPGAIPLRPLGLGDLYDGAFRIIRYNPRATVGAAVLVAALAMVIPVLVTAVLTWTVGASLDLADPAADPTLSDAAGILGAVASLVLGAVLQQVGLLLVSGMVAHVVSAAAIGRRLSLGEAWGATRGQRWRLIGLTLVLSLALAAALGLYAVSYVVLIALLDATWPVVVWALVSVPLLLVAMVWFWVRIYYLAVPVMMIERLGILAALRRGHRLTRRAFWRTFGIGLLTVVLAGVAGYALSMPVSIVGQVVMFAVDPAYFLLVLVLTQAVSTVLSAAFASPFTTAVSALQYVDLRIRKEAFDVELMAQAGIPAA